jgi:hypothetical protein
MSQPIFLASIRALGAAMDRHGFNHSKRMRKIGERISETVRWETLEGAALNVAYEASSPNSKAARWQASVAKSMTKHASANKDARAPKAAAAIGRAHRNAADLHYKAAKEPGNSKRHAKAALAHFKRARSYGYKGESAKWDLYATPIDEVYADNGVAAKSAVGYSRGAKHHTMYGNNDAALKARKKAAAAHATAADNSPDDNREKRHRAASVAHMNRAAKLPKKREYGEAEETDESCCDACAKSGGSCGGKVGSGSGDPKKLLNDKKKNKYATEAVPRSGAGKEKKWGLTHVVAGSKVKLDNASGRHRKIVAGGKKNSDGSFAKYGSGGFPINTTKPPKKFQGEDGALGGATMSANVTPQGVPYPFFKATKKKRYQKEGMSDVKDYVSQDSFMKDMKQRQQGNTYVKVEGKPKLGSGARFKALAKKLSHEKGIRDPKAVAAAIGRRKYGAKKMGQLSHHEGVVVGAVAGAIGEADPAQKHDTSHVLKKGRATKVKAYGAFMDKSQPTHRQDTYKRANFKSRVTRLVKRATGTK